MKKNKEKHLKLIKSYRKLNSEEQLLFVQELDKEHTRQIEKEWEYLNQLNNRANVAQEVMKIQNEDGRPYFNVDWIVKNIMKFTDSEIKDLNIKKGKK